MSRLYEYYDVTGGPDYVVSDFPSVFHYDASTFYNYTQDNKYVSGLEIRNRTLSQGMGFVASGSHYQGVTFAVNWHGVSDIDYGMFSSIADAVAQIPKVLTYPLKIEVYGYGSLGELNLDSIKCQGQGALEVEVINHTVNLAGSANLITVGLNAHVSAVSGFTNLPEDCSGQRGSDYKDSYWSFFAKVFAQRSPDSQKETQNLSFVDASAAYNWPKMKYDLSTVQGFQTFNYFGGLYDGTVAFPVAPVNQENSLSLRNRYRDSAASGDMTTVVSYGTYFSKVRVRDCNKVKLTGVLVDGALYNSHASGDYVSYGTDNGLTVTNSIVLLKGCGVTRCTSTGVLSVNSVIRSTGSLIVSRIHATTYTGGGATPQVVSWQQSTPVGGIGVYLQDSTLVFDTSNTGRYMNTISDGMDIGLKAVNSYIGGGTLNVSKDVSYAKNAGDSDTITSHLQTFGHNTGMELTNSTLDFAGRFSSFLNLRGALCKNSHVRLPMFSVDDNQNEGWLLDSSVFYYGANASLINTLGGFSGGSFHAPLFHCDMNGVNLKALNNSTVGVDPQELFVSAVGMWGGNTVVGMTTEVSANWLMRNHGLAGSLGYLPSIIADNNSNVELVGLGYIRDTTQARPRGACGLARNNSMIRLIGFGDTRWTTITTSSVTDLAGSLERNWSSAALVAEKNSRIELTGPTKISKYGIDVLCEDSSQSYFGPIYESGARYTTQSSKYGLGNPANHTKVELHSSRACLVAEENSTIKMHGMGGVGNVSSISINFGSLSRTYQDTSSGYAFFFPNGFTHNNSGVEVGASLLDIYTRNGGLVSGSDDHVSGTTGGMCVRAVDNSDVDVDFVNFKFGAPASSVSGVMYNFFGSGAEFVDDASATWYPSPTTNFCDIIADCITDCCTTVYNWTGTRPPPTTTNGWPNTTVSSATFTTGVLPPPPTNTTAATTIATTLTSNTLTEETTPSTPTTTPPTDETPTTPSTSTPTETTPSTSPTEATTIRTTMTYVPPTTESLTSTSTTPSVEPTWSAMTSTIGDPTPSSTVSTYGPPSTQTGLTTPSTDTTFHTERTTLQTVTIRTDTITQETTFDTWTSYSTVSSIEPSTFTEESTQLPPSTESIITSPPPPTTVITASSIETQSITSTESTVYTEPTTPTETLNTVSLRTPGPPPAGPGTTVSTMWPSTATAMSVATTVHTMATTTTTHVTTTTATALTPTTNYTTVLTNTTKTDSTFTELTETPWTTGVWTTLTSVETVQTPTSIIYTPYTRTNTAYTAPVTTDASARITQPQVDGTQPAALEWPLWALGTGGGGHNAIPHPGDNSNIPSGIGPVYIPGADDGWYFSSLDFSSFGSKIHIWNVGDTSRLKVTNTLINGVDPQIACVNSTWHGPTGRWPNAANCDLYGKYGDFSWSRRYETNDFYNYGIFRLMSGVRGSLKTLYEVGITRDGTSPSFAPQLAEGGGSPLDQVGAQGYLSMFDESYELDHASIVSGNIIPLRPRDRNWETAESIFGRGLGGGFSGPGQVTSPWLFAAGREGYGMTWDHMQLHPSFTLPPLHLKWQGYLSNHLDESSANLFANAKHGSSKMINLCTVYRAVTQSRAGGVGRDGYTSEYLFDPLTYGTGVRSLNTFELTQLV